MKKVYEKPQIYMERFELSQSIASCYFNFGNSSNDPNSCQATEGSWGLAVFANNKVCENIEENYCYENATGANTFNS